MGYIRDSVINCFKKQLCELENNPDKISRVKARFLKNQVIPTIEGYKTVDVIEKRDCGKCLYGERHHSMEPCVFCNSNSYFEDFFESNI